MLCFIQRDGRNAPLNELDKNGCTPLMYAALSDSDSAIEMLLNLSVRREQVNKCKALCSLDIYSGRSCWTYSSALCCLFW